MNTIDLNCLLKDLDGNNVPDITAGKIVAAQLVNTSQGSVVKHWDWALALHKGQPITVDNADLEYLRKFVENRDTLSILAKHRLLDMLKPGNSGPHPASTADSSSTPPETSPTASLPPEKPV